MNTTKNHFWNPALPMRKHQIDHAGSSWYLSDLFRRLSNGFSPILLDKTGLRLRKYEQRHPHASGVFGRCFIECSTAMN